MQDQNTPELPGYAYGHFCYSFIYLKVLILPSFYTDDKQFKS